MTTPTADQTNDGVSESEAPWWWWPVRNGIRGYVGLFVLVTVCYGIGSILAIRLAEASDLQGVFFIPAGITAAFLLRVPRRGWWVILAAAAVTEFAMDVNSELPRLASLGFAAANTAEPLVGALIATRAIKYLDLARRRDLFWFTLGSVVVGPLVGAAIGAFADRYLGGDEFFATFWQWWLGDALGVILVGGAILAWGSSPDRKRLLSPWGVVLIMASVTMTVLVVAATDLPLVFTVLIGVIVAGALFGVRAVVMTSLAIAMTVALILVAGPDVLIVGMEPATALVLIKLQVGTFAMTGLLVAAESNERDLAASVAVLAAAEAENQARERERQRELAVQVQRGLLPDRLLDVDGIDLGARYEAADDAFEVGGDWYDTLDLGEGRVGLAVGDIVGHGLEAMTAMGRLRTAFAALALQDPEPAGLLTSVERFIRSPDGTDYVTVFYAMVDIPAGIITYSSAGHPPALFIRSTGEPVWLDQGQTGPLYSGSIQSRSQAIVECSGGGTLVLFSDGLVERRGEPLEDGLARLADLVPDLVWKPASEICDHLASSLGIDRGRDDDVVILVAKLLPTSSSVFSGRYPARPEELSRIRDEVREWCRSCGLAAEVSDDLLILVGESCANVVRHAYADRSQGEVGVTIVRGPARADVEVRDWGIWVPPSPASAGPGMGIEIMQKLVTDLVYETNDDGTRLTFSLPLEVAEVADSL
ncbi:MAG TPA: SpoIIE family protein phosphatase [Acidimicrobiia bacterium]|nr:SpoIIE family protein phosphatase [Acidimicrobiia bacterium]